LKPRLKDDVRFVPRPDGVFVMVPSRPDLGFTLGGPRTYQWLARLGPFLTGEHTLDELVGRLDDARRDRIRSLVALLHREGAVRDAAGDLPHTLPEEVRRAHARVIDFISHGADSPEHRFQRYRECAPVVVGSGRLVAPLVQALLATGVARVRLMPTPERAIDLDRMRHCLALGVGPDAGRRLVVEDYAEPSLGASGPVLHVCDTPMVARCAGLAARCVPHRQVFGQATIAGDGALIGPVGEADRFDPGWGTTVWRWTGGGAAEPVRDRPDDPVSGYLAGPAAAVVANQLCAAFLKQVTGLATEASGRFVEVDLETLRAGVRPVAAVAGRAA
jgi:hypothetical protein